MYSDEMQEKESQNGVTNVMMVKRHFGGDEVENVTINFLTVNVQVLCIFLN